MTMHVHIERLVVEGFETGADVAAGLETTLRSHLHRLLTARGLATVPGGDDARLDSLACPDIQSPKRADGTVIGARVAESLHSGLTAIAPFASNGKVGGR